MHGPHNPILRKLDRMILVALIIFDLFTHSMSVVAEDLVKQRAITDYVEAAFAQSEALMKPARTPRISYYCPAQFCSDLVLYLKSDFPSNIEQSEKSAPDSVAEIQVRMFPTADAKKADSPTFVREKSDTVATLKHDECSLIRVSQGDVVKHVIVDVVFGPNIRASELCALEEVIRGTGFIFPDIYPEYVMKFSNLSDVDYQTVIRGYRNVAVYHWSPLTQPGMTRSAVEQALQSIEWH